MKRIKILWILIALLGCTSDKDREVLYYPSGAINEEYELQDGKRNGVARGYYPNGTLRAIGFYRNGLPDSIYIQYHENGNKKVEGYYGGNGIEVGETRLYFDNGALQQLQYHDDAGKVIDFVTYNRDGSRDFSTASVTFESVSDTIRLGEYYEAKIRLANRKYTYSDVIIGDPNDRNIGSKAKLPKLDSVTCILKIQPDIIGEYFIEGVVMDVDLGDKIGEYTPIRDYRAIKFKKSIWILPQK